MASLDALLGMVPTATASAAPSSASSSTSASAVASAAASPALSSNPATAASASSSSSSSAAAPSAWVSGLFNQLVQSTRLANALPDPDEYKFLISSNPSFASQSKAVQGRILNVLGLLSESILHRNESSLERNAKRMKTSTGEPGGIPPCNLYTSKQSDSLDLFHTLVDSVDSALEAVDMALDEHRGVKRAGLPTKAASIIHETTKRGPTSSAMLQKPQLAFQHLIDNSPRPWIPIIKTKPHALTPLPDYERMREEWEKSCRRNNVSIEGAAASTSTSSSSSTRNVSSTSPQLSPAVASHLASLGQNSDGHHAHPQSLHAQHASFPHPYQTEIESLVYPAGGWQTQTVKEQLFESLQAVPCSWVDTLDELERMISCLEGAREIAIDLEHHSFRTYQGLTCLMQLSTRTHDFLVDTIALRTELWRLNEFTANPDIAKVLHGADSDILWLQRDLGLYIVNLFDTGQAARVLELPSFGLAYLLQHYCGVKTDKRYQLADWRMRPLSAEMLLYARMDTHYLLYIGDRLRNQLIEASNKLQPIPLSSPTAPGCPALLAQVLERSRAISLKVYEKESVDHATQYAMAMEFAYKQGIILGGNNNEVQSRVLRALFALRDELARRDDESIFYMCSNSNLVALINHMPGSMAEMQSILSRPLPPMVRKHGAEVLSTIAAAKEGTIGGGGGMGSSSEGKLSLTSPYLAAALPPVTASPAMRAGAGGDAGDAMDLGAPAMETPQKLHVSTGATSKSLGGGGGGLPPVSMTPATATSTLFAALSTATPQTGPRWLGEAASDVGVSGTALNSSVPSPVLGTEQLYSASGWIAAGKSLERSIAATKTHQHGTTSNQMHSSIFDLNSVDVSSSSSNTAHHALLSPAPKASPLSLLASSTALPADASASVRMQQARQHVVQAAASIPPVHPISTLMMATPIKNQRGATSDHSMQDVAAPPPELDSAVLGTPDTGEPKRSFISPSPMSLSIIPSPLPHASSNSKSDSFQSIAKDVPQTAQSIAAGATKAVSASPDSPLPMSMREIYKISNENRRKNKEKKKKAIPAANTAQQHASTETGEADEDGHGSTGTNAASKKGRRSNTNGLSLTDGTTSSPPTSSEEFMRDIGWENGSASTQTQQQSQQQPHSASFVDSLKKRKHSGGSSSGGSGSGSASLSFSPPSGGASLDASAPVFTPFDYSTASLSMAHPSSSTAPGAQAWNPYSDMGRDASELKKAAGTAASTKDPSQRIYKNHTQLKQASRSITVRLDSDTHAGRPRGGSAGSNLPMQGRPGHGHRR